MKTINYLGETKDFSDKWLIGFLGEEFAVRVLGPRSSSLPKADLTINRLYTTTIDRYGIGAVNSVIDLLEDLGKHGEHILNSIKGYLLDIDKLEQYKFFQANGLPYLSTSKASGENTEISFPVVVKGVQSGRSNMLSVIEDLDTLESLPANILDESVIQPYVDEEICYRTEFIGDYHVTFPEKVAYKEGKISFAYERRIIPTPLEDELVKDIRSVLGKEGISVFSLEYFLIGNKKDPAIIDFNLTSNYRRFLIKECKIEGELKKAWLKIIHENI